MAKQTSKSKEVKSPMAKEPPNDHSVAKRWSEALAEDGFVPVVNYFLEHYHELRPYSLTHGEAMFVIHLMSFKWGEDAPYPGYKTIAKRMGVTDKTARRYAQNLDQKKYLLREKRAGQPNKFHLDNLIKALEKHRSDHKKE